jgi:hypothetical protein
MIRTTYFQIYRHLTFIHCCAESYPKGYGQDSPEYQLREHCKAFMVSAKLSIGVKWAKLCVTQFRVAFNRLECSEGIPPIYQPAHRQPIDKLVNTLNSGCQFAGLMEVAKVCGLNFCELGNGVSNPPIFSVSASFAILPSDVFISLPILHVIAPYLAFESSRKLGTRCIPSPKQKRSNHAK